MPLIEEANIESTNVINVKRGEGARYQIKLFTANRGRKNVNIVKIIKHQAN